VTSARQTGAETCPLAVISCNVAKYFKCSVAATRLKCEVDGVFHNDFLCKFIVQYDNERILKMSQLLTNLRKEVALRLTHNRKWPGILRQ